MQRLFRCPPPQARYLGNTRNSDHNQTRCWRRARAFPDGKNNPKILSVLFHDEILPERGQRRNVTEHEQRMEHSGDRVAENEQRGTDRRDDTVATGGQGRLGGRSRVAATARPPYPARTGGTAPANNHAAHPSAKTSKMRSASGIHKIWTERLFLSALMEVALVGSAAGGSGAEGPKAPGRSVARASE